MRPHTLVGRLAIAVFLVHCGCSETPPKPFIDFEVDAGALVRLDRPVAFEIVRAAFVNGETGYPNVVEVDAAGSVVDADVLFQVDPGTAGVSGEVVVLLSGTTKAHEKRRYRVSFTSGEPPPVDTPALVAVEEIGVYQGDASIQVVAQNATYIYHKHGSGFASIMDSDGNDWVSYRADQKGPRGAYRGIPNLENAGFHPGESHRKGETRVLSTGPIRVRLLSATADGRWKCVWDIYPKHATMTLLKRSYKRYWFLYEGTPGGEFDLADYWVRSNGQRSSLAPFDRDHIWQESLPSPKWVYFGDAAISRVLYFVHHTAGHEEDQLWHFGQGTMTVFGFGRGAHGTQRWQQLKAVPGKFTIGFAPDGEFQAAAAVIQDTAAPPTVQQLD